MSHMVCQIVRVGVCVKRSMEGIPNHVPAGTEAGACRSGGGGTSIYADEEHDAHIRGLAKFI